MDNSVISQCSIMNCPTVCVCVDTVRSPKPSVPILGNLNKLRKIKLWFSNKEEQSLAKKSGSDFCFCLIFDLADLFLQTSSLGTSDLHCICLVTSAVQMLTCLCLSQVEATGDEGAVQLQWGTSLPQQPPRAVINTTITLHTVVVSCESQHHSAHMTLTPSICHYLRWSRSADPAGSGGGRDTVTVCSAWGKVGLKLQLFLICIYNDL